MGMKWIEFSFQQRPVPQPKLHRNVVKAARCESTIKMPHSRNDHSDDRYINVGTGLIENEKVEPLLLGKTDAGSHLLARAKAADLRVKIRLDRSFVAWRQKRMIAQTQRGGPIKARFFSGPTSHEANGQKLVQFGHRAEQRDPRIKV